MFRERITLVVLGAALFFGCSSKEPQGAQGASSSGDQDAGALPTGPAASPKANVRWKRVERLRNDIAQALGLLPEEVCNELGKYSCADLVHTVALGGVDAYASGIFEPAPDTSATAPLAVDRLVLSACIERAKRDVGDPANAVVFTKLSVDAAGKLADKGSSEVKDAIDRLYKRAVQRPATPAEIEHLTAFYEQVEAKATGEPARQWATLTCYAVLTSVEFLFY